VSAADSLHVGYGAIRVPLAETGEQDLGSLDPARDILLELFRAALLAELEPRWDPAVAGTPLRKSRPVETLFPEFPEQVFLQQQACRWPMLAVYRSDNPETYDQHTLWERRITARWGVDYCIGPLELGNFIKLNSVLTLVPRIIEGVIEAGGHMAYATQAIGNTVQLKRVFGSYPGGCYFNSIRVVEARSGTASFAQDGPKYHCASVVLETTELEQPLSTELAPRYQGTSVTLESGDTTGLAPIVVADTAVPLPK
jgi:hypothetical protein